MYLRVADASVFREAFLCLTGPINKPSEFRNGEDTDNASRHKQGKELYLVYPTHSERRFLTGQT